MIARLIDFFLGRESHQDCFFAVGKKRFEIGNKFVETPFSPLIECVSILISKAKPLSTTKIIVITLSQKDILALESLEFYRKAIENNYNLLKTSAIAKSFCEKNKIFSEQFAKLILKGICTSNSEKIVHYLDVMGEFLSISDGYTYHRMEWIFGYATLKTNYKGDYESLPNLEEPIISYNTKLKEDNIQPVLQFLYENRNTWENITLQILKKIFEMVSTIENMKIYMLSIPPPNNSCGLYLSWVRPYLKQLKRDIKDTNKKTANTGKQRDDLIHSVFEIYENAEKQMNTKIKQINSIGFKMKSQSVEQELDESKLKHLKSQWPQYIIGKTLDKYEISCSLIGEDVETDSRVYLRIFEVKTVYTDSQPTGSTNTIFPKSIMKGQNIQLSFIDLNESNINEFFLTSSLQEEKQNKINHSTKKQELKQTSTNGGKEDSLNLLSKMFNRMKAHLSNLKQEKSSEDKLEDVNKKKESSAEPVVVGEEEKSKEPQIDEKSSESTIGSSSSIVPTDTLLPLNLIRNEGQIIRRFEIQNQSLTKSAKVSVFFTYSNKLKQDLQSHFVGQVTLQRNYNKPKLNQYMPIEIEVEVPPNSQMHFFSTKKIDPTEDWKHYEVNCNCKFVDTSVIIPQLLEKKSNISSMQKQETTSKISDSINSSSITDKSESQTKSCPACTYLQSTLNQQCTMCYSSLR